MEDRLVGIDVQIEIEEDGTDRPPRLPPGRIVRRLIGPDRGDYYLVELKHPVTCLRASNRMQWVLANLVVATKFAGDSLDRQLSRWQRRAIHVGIACYLGKPSPDDPTLDLARVEYFAVGTVRRV